MRLFMRRRGLHSAPSTTIYPVLRLGERPNLTWTLAAGASNTHSWERVPFFTEKEKSRTKRTFLFYIWHGEKESMEGGLEGCGKTILLFVTFSVRATCIVVRRGCGEEVCRHLSFLQADFLQNLVKKEFELMLLLTNASGGRTKFSTVSFRYICSTVLL